MLHKILPSVSKVFLHTGNMLYYTDITKQVNMLTTEQIIEGLKTCVSHFDQLPEPEDDCLYLRRNILVNQTEEDKKNLQTMIKVFVTSDDLNSLKTALEYTLNDLKMSCIDSVILSYQSKSNNQESVLEDFKFMWKILENFASKGKISNLGVKPNIHQINLNACCVVPKDLQDFCKERDIRILTHNDPADILPVKELLPLLNNSGVESDQEFANVKLAWVTRFQAHIKCRGILSSKGYIVCLNLN